MWLSVDLDNSDPRCRATKGRQTGERRKEQGERSDSQRGAGPLLVNLGLLRSRFNSRSALDNPFPFEDAPARIRRCAPFRRSANLGKPRSFLRRCAAGCKVRTEKCAPSKSGARGSGFARFRTGNIIESPAIDFGRFSWEIAPRTEVVVSTTTGSLLLDEARQSMEVLAGFLDKFVAAWEESTAPPDLKTFLPEAGEIRRLTLVELIKVDLEYRWLNKGCPKRLAEYLAEFAELAQGRVPCDLIYEEFHIRKQSGQNVTADEYLQAFPAQVAEIVSILGVEQPYESSSFHKTNKRERLAAVQPGETLDDFDLLVELGSGAFAKVFLARQRSMQRLVALKVATDTSDEPQTLAQLDHDHIVRVYDQRSLADRKLRLLYMQYIAGGTLQAVIQRVRQTPPAERSGKLILDVIDESLARRGESRPSESSLRAWLAKATLAGSRLLARGENRPGVGLRPSAGRAAPRREARQYLDHSGGLSQTGRLQYQLQRQGRRRNSGGLFWRQPRLYVARATRGVSPGARSVAGGAGRPKRPLFAGDRALGAY